MEKLRIIPEHVAWHKPRREEVEDSFLLHLLYLFLTTAMTRLQRREALQDIEFLLKSTRGQA